MLISEGTLAVHMKYEALGVSLSAKWIKNLTRVCLVLLILGVVELPEFLILEYWLLRYCAFDENIQIWLFKLHWGFKNCINGLRQCRNSHLLVLTMDSTRI